MTELHRERVDRVLGFLAVSGGAALVCKRSRRVVAASGEVDATAAVAALAEPLADPDSIRHVGSHTVITDVGLQHRLFIVLPTGSLPDASFLHRVRRARDLLDRFGLRLGAPRGSAPPGNAPAHAVVFAWRR